MNLAAELDPEVASSDRQQRWIVWVLAAASFAAVLIANASGISIGDDGVGYQAIADSLARGDGYGYFLERPVTVWPPIWPGLMALVSRLTPLGTVGAAVLLNAIVSVGVVLLGNKLLRKAITSERIVLLGTIVLALGPATIGLGHVLMTDMAFALVVMAWMLLLIRFWEKGSIGDLVIAAMLVWVAFGVRYVGLVLIAIGGLWILLDSRGRLVERVRNGILYGVVSVLAPAVWMLRNYNIDETFTGERHTSARGFIDNGFDLTATIGRFLVPGVANGATKIWSAIGVAATVTAVIGLWIVLSKRPAGAVSAGAVSAGADAAPAGAGPA
ncbi:MAG: glycosyltransferase family 39 protein, partial [Microthrixaceae bacterium]